MPLMEGRWRCCTIRLAGDASGWTTGMRMHACVRVHVRMHMCMHTWTWMCTHHSIGRRGVGLEDGGHYPQLARRRDNGSGVLDARQHCERLTHAASPDDCIRVCSVARCVARCRARAPPIAIAERSGGDSHEVRGCRRKLRRVDNRRVDGKERHAPRPVDQEVCERLRADDESLLYLTPSAWSASGGRGDVCVCAATVPTGIHRPPRQLTLRVAAMPLAAAGRPCARSSSGGLHSRRRTVAAALVRCEYAAECGAGKHFQLPWSPSRCVVGPVGAARGCSVGPVSLAIGRRHVGPLQVRCETGIFRTHAARFWRGD